MVVILLLNVIEVFSVGGGALLYRQSIVFQLICVLYLLSQCASKCFFQRVCFCFGMSEVILSFKSLRVGSQVFALLMLFLSVIFHTMWSVSQPAVAMNLTLWYVVLLCRQYDVCTNYVGSVYVGGYGGLSESGLCVFRELCPVGIL